MADFPKEDTVSSDKHHPMWMPGLAILEWIVLVKWSPGSNAYSVLPFSNTHCCLWSRVFLVSITSVRYAYIQPVKHRNALFHKLECFIHTTSCPKCVIIALDCMSSNYTTDSHRSGLESFMKWILIVGKSILNFIRLSKYYLHWEQLIMIGRITNVLRIPFWCYEQTNPWKLGQY